MLRFYAIKKKYMLRLLHNIIFYSTEGNRMKIYNKCIKLTIATHPLIITLNNKKKKSMMKEQSMHLSAVSYFFNTNWTPAVKKKEEKRERSTTERVWTDIVNSILLKSTWLTETHQPHHLRFITETFHLKEALLNYFKMMSPRTYWNRHKACTQYQCKRELLIKTSSPPLVSPNTEKCDVCHFLMMCLTQYFQETLGGNPYKPN